MKNKRMILGIAVLVMAMITACGQKQQYDDDSDFKVVPVEGGKSLRITEYMGKKQIINIPPRMGKLPITHIGEGAFKGRDLISVAIPNTVIAIEGEKDNGAFCENRLTSLTIPNSVNYIGYGAFWKNQITSVTIGSKVTHIGEYAFYENPLVGDITIPKSVTTIGEWAFAGAWDYDNDKPLGTITSVTLGNKVVSIGDYAFANNQLASVTIPKSVTSIGIGAFEHCNSLTAINVNTGNPTYSSHDGILYSKDKTTLLKYPGGKTGAFTIPDTVITIGENAFAYCTSLTSVTIGNGVTSIGDRAFVGVWDKDNNKSLGTITSVTIGNGVTTIGKSAFNSNQLTSVTIPGSVTSIGDSAFYGNQLTSVTIGAGVKLGEEYYTFIDSFDDAYINGGRRAGTYTKSGTRWTRQSLPQTTTPQTASAENTPSNQAELGFSSGFIGTWKRDNYNNILTVNRNTVTISSRTHTWDLLGISGDFYTLKRPGAEEMDIVMKLTNGRLVITEDTGAGQENWNGTWVKQ